MKAYVRVIGVVVLALILGACDHKKKRDPVAPAEVLPVLLIEDMVISEGDAGNRYLDVFARLQSSSDKDVTFDYRTRDGSATVSNNDYVASSGTETIMARPSSILPSAPLPPDTAIFTIVINGDSDYEQDETFTIDITNVSGAVLASPVVTVTITNDDAIGGGPTIPAPPSGLRATTMPQTVNLQWDVVSNATSYTVYWSTEQGAGKTGTPFTTTAPSFLHSPVSNGIPYYYVVTASNAAGESAASAEYTATANDVLVSSLVFADANLAACVDAMGKTYVGELTSLDCVSKNVSSLSGIESLEKLVSVQLQGNNITDISPLSNLADITRLGLSSNTISSIDALSNLGGLTQLGLDSTGISDISVLAGLTNLTSLSIGRNNITDFNPLAGLRKLTSLDVTSNQVGDINIWSNLTELTLLYAYNSGISDITPLSILTKLRFLSLGMNNISDISPLSGLTELTYLQLEFNDISNVAPLSALTKIDNLIVTYNPVGSAGPGGVDKLETLTRATRINLSNQPSMSCDELGFLISRLGSPPVDLDHNKDTADAIMPGTNCTALPTAPAAPSSLALSVGIQATTTSVTATWRDRSDNEDNFVIQFGSSPTTLNQILNRPANSVSYTYTGLPKKVPYTICARIKAVNIVGSSSYTPVQCVSYP